MRSNWLVGDQAAADKQLLDAAGRCFAHEGVPRTTMSHIAAEAGCSRPTLYRYFPDRETLHTAFIHRESQRVAATVARQLTAIPDPSQRLVAAMLAALREVRSNPPMMAWFTSPAVGHTTVLARSSAVIESLAGGFVVALGSGGKPDLAVRDGGEAARWLIRVLLSLLAAPETDERGLLERFVVPAFFTYATPRGAL
jgi:AcrR family transcriptional regulator